MAKIDQSRQLQPIIFIIDDDTSFRQLVAEALEEDGYATVQCGSRQELEHAIEQGVADAFVIDLRLPDGNGLDVLRSLRMRTTAPVMLISGVNDEVDVVLALELGADDFVTKPVRLRELRARLKAIRRRSASSSAVSVDEDIVIEAGGLTINANARTVYDPHGSEISLSTLEFDVLLVLARRTNRVFSRDEIMDKVRGPNWASYDRSIDGLISRLRSKLFAGTGVHASIKTVRGVGYMFSTT